jgi:PAS domain S-box-containing protein
MYYIAMTIVDIVTILGGLSGVAGTIYGFYKFVLKPLFQLLLRLRRSFEILEKMHEEFKPNGGSSLRDAINRIETKLLIEQHARRAVSMAMDVGIFETDGEGLCTWVNQYYSNITGLTTEEAKNFGWVNGIFEDDRDRVVEEWESAVKQKRIFKLEFGMLNSRTSEYNLVQCTAFPITTVKNEVIGFIGIVAKRNQELVRPKYITSA